MEAAQARKRPIGVWVIAVYFAITVPFLIFSIYLALADKVPLSPEEAAYVAAQTPLDHFFTALIGTCNMVGAVNLFRLRKAALPFFGAALVINIALTVWHIVAKGFIAVMGSFVPVALGLAVLLAITAYTAYLSKKQILR